MKWLGGVRAVGATAVVAAVVAALTFGIAHQVAHAQALKLSLTAGSGFTITSNIYASPSCSGPTAQLDPGVTRCLVYTVQNNLSVPISVQSINMALDSTFPAPPSGCSASDLSLPTFSGSFNVPGGGSANSPGLPISLIDNGNQTNCENTTLHFAYTGSAQYTDSTTTVLGSSLNPSNSGQSVTFTATVTANNPSSDTSNPTGTVNFYSCASATNCTTPAPTLLGTGTITAGQATFTTTSLATGSTFVEATYQGASTNFTSSTSGVVTQVVNSSGVSTTTTLTSGTNPSNSGQSVTFSATVAKTTGTGNPTGTVNFYSCASATNCTSPSPTLLGSGTLISGKATFSTSSLSVGNTFVEAIYQGVSGTYGASTSSILTQVVTSIATTTTLTSAPNPSVTGGSVTFTATVAKTTGTGTPTGTVNFYSCASATNCTTPAPTLLGSGTLTSGKATFSTSSLPVGNTFVEAIYQGVSGSFGASTSTVVTQVVGLVGTTTSLGSTPNPSASGGSVTFTATVARTSGTGTPTGTVNFYSCASATNCTSLAPTLLGSGTLSSGKATFTTSSLAVGNTFVEAIYQGVSGSVGASTSSIVTQVVNSIATSTSLTSGTNPSVSGQSVTFKAVVAKTSGTGTPTGTVNFYSCTSATGPCTTLLGTGTLSSGTATFTTSGLPVGTTYVEAVYGGVTGSFGTSTSNIVTQVVTAIPTTTSLTSSPNPSLSGGSVGFTATVAMSFGTGTPTGTVNFYSCTSATNCASPAMLGSGTLSSGKATYSTTTLPVGNTFVEAIYQGDPGTVAVSTSSIMTQVVNSIATSTSLTSSPNPSVSSGSVVFSAVVAKTTGTGTPTGTVNFYSCASATNCTTPALLGSATLSSGKATFTTSSLPIGSTYVEAIYQGVSGSFGTSTSGIVTQVVTAISTTTSLTSAPNPSLHGESVTLSATVTKSSGSATPGGTVSFYSGTPSGTHTLLGTGTLNGSAQATYPTSSLAAATDSLYAVYAGAGSFTGSTSPVISQVVIGSPASCTGTYANVIIGNPAYPVVLGPSGNDFFYLFGANYIAGGYNGTDCFDAGDGNNAIGDGNGNDVVIAGNGNNGVLLGNGNDSIAVGNGSNVIAAANGTDAVSIGNGSDNGVVLGNGTDTVTIGTGSDNTIDLGNGNDTVTVQSPGSGDTINGGSGNETIYLGSGTNNTFNGGKGHNTCHLPAPPSSWHGTTAAYYHDTITNCTVVSP